MRAGVARRVGYTVERGGSAQQAVEEALDWMEERVGGNGGVIAIDHEGQVGLDWNSDVMAWAWARDGWLHYGIYKDDDFVERL